MKSKAVGHTWGSLWRYDGEVNIWLRAKGLICCKVTKKYDLQGTSLRVKQASKRDVTSPPARPLSRATFDCRDEPQPASLRAALQPQEPLFTRPYSATQPCLTRRHSIARVGIQRVRIAMAESSRQTASTYINNLLLARGLLRNGATIDFACPEKADGGVEATMSQVMSLVHDFILRRDVRTLKLEHASNCS